MSPDLKAPVTITIPDDFPSVFENTPAHERCRKVGETKVYTARGADDETELIKRIDAARVAINIRAHARFTDHVMQSCRKLEMISIWGTGTDNIDLDAAGRHGITVCNTPGVNAFAVAEHTLALMLAATPPLPLTLSICNSRHSRTSFAPIPAGSRDWTIRNPSATSSSDTYSLMPRSVFRSSSVSVIGVVARSPAHSSREKVT